MPLIGVNTDLEGIQKRWILGALALALVAHLVLAWAMGWYKIPSLEVPISHTTQPGPFTMKHVEIYPKQLKSQQDDPAARMPVVEPPKSPSEFNLDPNLVEKQLQTPQPALAMPSVPEPNRVIAATDVSQGLPYAESDASKVTAEISHVEPGAGSGPQMSSKFAQELISSTSGPVQQGALSGAPVTGNGTAGKLPGFAQLAPTFRAPEANLSNLPEPILLRLPSDVLFDFDSAKLKPEADGLLGQAVGMITKYPQASVQVDGYSDSIGKPDYNQTLSQQRAEAVQAWLQDRVSQSGYKFHSQGHGSSNYVVSSQGTIEQQQPNRRVEILIQALKP